MQLLSPSEIVDLAEKIGIQKCTFSSRKTIMLGILAGIYIGMGALLSLLIGAGFPEVTANNPGMQRILSGITFPVGLILVVISGAELFTGNNAVLMPGWLNKKISSTQIIRNWMLVYFANFAGSLFFVYVLVFLAGIADADPWKSAIIEIATIKTSLSWDIVFLRGIGANWLVCLAIWMGMSAKTTTGKLVGLWFPIMTFVAIGYEHSIANMFFIPLGMLQGANVSIGQFIVDNLIPATLGNIVGGAFFVGAYYWYTYKT